MTSWPHNCCQLLQKDLVGTRDPLFFCWWFYVRVLWFFIFLLLETTNTLRRYMSAVQRSLGVFPLYMVRRLRSKWKSIIDFTSVLAKRCSLMGSSKKLLVNHWNNYIKSSSGRADSALLPCEYLLLAEMLVTFIPEVSPLARHEGWEM